MKKVIKNMVFLIICASPFAEQVFAGGGGVSSPPPPPPLPGMGVAGGVPPPPPSLAVSFQTEITEPFIPYSWQQALSNWEIKETLGGDDNGNGGGRDALFAAINAGRGGGFALRKIKQEEKTEPEEKTLMEQIAERGGKSGKKELFSKFIDPTSGKSEIDRVKSGRKQMKGGLKVEISGKSFEYKSIDDYKAYKGEVQKKIRETENIIQERLKPLKDKMEMLRAIVEDIINSKKDITINQGINLRKEFLDEKNQDCKYPKALKAFAMANSLNVLGYIDEDHFEMLKEIKDFLEKEDVLGTIAEVTVLKKYVKDLRAACKNVPELITAVGANRASVLTELTDQEIEQIEKSEELSPADKAQVRKLDIEIYYWKELADLANQETQPFWREGGKDTFLSRIGTEVDIKNEKYKDWTEKILGLIFKEFEFSGKPDNDLEEQVKKSVANVTGKLKSVLDGDLQSVGGKFDVCKHIDSAFRYCRNEDLRNQYIQECWDEWNRGLRINDIGGDLQEFSLAFENFGEVLQMTGLKEEKKRKLLHIVSLSIKHREMFFRKMPSLEEVLRGDKGGRWTQENVKKLMRSFGLGIEKMCTAWLEGRLKAEDVLNIAIKDALDKTAQDKKREEFVELLWETALKEEEEREKILQFSALTEDDLKMFLEEDYLPDGEFNSIKTNLGLFVKKQVASRQKVNLFFEKIKEVCDRAIKDRNLIPGSFIGRVRMVKEEFQDFKEASLWTLKGICVLEQFCKEKIKQLEDSRSKILRKQKTIKQKIDKIVRGNSSKKQVQEDAKVVQQRKEKMDEFVSALNLSQVEAVSSQGNSMLEKFEKENAHKRQKLTGIDLFEPVAHKIGKMEERLKQAGLSPQKETVEKDEIIKKQNEEIAKKQGEINELTQEINRLRDFIEKMKKEIADSERARENDRLASRAQADVEAARAAVEEEMQVLHLELNETRLRSDELRAKSENAENALKAAKADFEREKQDMQGRLDQIEKELQEYQKKEKESQLLNEQLSAATQAKVAAEQREKQKQRELEQVREELNKTKKDLNDSRNKEQDLRSKLTKADEISAKNAQDFQAKLNTAKAQSDKQEQDLRSDLEEKAENLNKQLSAVNQAKTAAEQKAQNLDSRVKELEDQNKALKEENEALKNRPVGSSGSTIIRNDNEESQALKSELDQMRAETENKERALKQKDNHIQSLENTVANLRQQVAEVKEQAKANRSRSRDAFGSETDDLSLQRQQLSTVREELIEKNEALQKLQMNLNEREKSLNSREKAVKAVENERATAVKRDNSGNATEKVLPNDIQFGIGDTSGNVNVVPGTQVHVPMALPLQIEDAQKSERLENPILQHRSVNDRSFMMPNRAR